MRSTFLYLCCLLMVTSCVSREKADEKLELGCRAAVEMYIDDGLYIKEIKRVTSKSAPELGDAYRELMIFAVESDSWVDRNKQYKCVFTEAFDVMSYQATFYQLSMAGKLYGFKEGQSDEEAEEYEKLLFAVENAMR